VRSIIDLSNIDLPKKLDSRISNSENPDQLNFIFPNTSLITDEENMIFLKEKFPEKILFTIQETADVLNLSAEFIRKRIVAGSLAHVSFGDRKIIHFKTLAALITKGI
jgi:hypothetical protein